MGVPWRLGGWRRHCHCAGSGFCGGAGSVPGLGTCACRGRSHKKGLLLHPPHFFQTHPQGGVEGTAADNPGGRKQTSHSALSLPVVCLGTHTHVHTHVHMHTHTHTHVHKVHAGPHTHKHAVRDTCQPPCQDGWAEPHGLSWPRETPPTPHPGLQLMGEEVATPPAPCGGRCRPRTEVTVPRLLRPAVP